MNKDSAKKYVLKDFDFAKVSKAMYMFDWTWSDLGRTPTAEELEEVASGLLDDILTGGATEAKTGGLVARLENEEGNRILVLEFVLESGQGW